MNKLVVLCFMLGCVACQPQDQSSHMPIAAQPKQAMQSASLTVSAAPTMPVHSESSEAIISPSEQAKPLAMSDSIGPWPLEVSQISSSQLGTELAEADTITGRFLIIKSEEVPRFLYRTNVADTTWTELSGLLDQYQYGHQQQEIEVWQANLDGKGQPEVLVKFISADYGSGGGYHYTSNYLLDVTAYPPRLLLRATTGFVLESFGAYAAMHGMPPADYEEYSGYERIVRLRPQEIVIGTIKARSKKSEPLWRSELTQLPTGRYRYQHDKIFRVRK